MRRGDAGRPTLRRCASGRSKLARGCVYAISDGHAPPPAAAAPTTRFQQARLGSANAETVAFRWKDYRSKRGDRQKLMQPATDEFIRSFLIHVLLHGFNRIRHYGFLAGAG
uniref:transposase n=1 Tax=Roseivivax sediminis TaxID=936889 RepID=UPI00122C6A0A